VTDTDSGDLLRAAVAAVELVREESVSAVGRANKLLGAYCVKIKHGYGSPQIIDYACILGSLRIKVIEHIERISYVIIKRLCLRTKFKKISVELSVLNLGAGVGVKGDIGSRTAGKRSLAVIGVEPLNEGAVYVEHKLGVVRSPTVELGLYAKVSVFIFGSDRESEPGVAILAGAPVLSAGKGGHSGSGGRSVSFLVSAGHLENVFDRTLIDPTLVIDHLYVLPDFFELVGHKYLLKLLLN
jgi:hypothetical protein